MEKTQRRVSRLLEIIIALEAGGEWHAANLAERFGVSRTRIFNDIRELREAGVPVRRTRAGYRIDASFFQVLPVLLRKSRAAIKAAEAKRGLMQSV